MDLGYKLALAIPSAMLRIRTASNSPESRRSSSIPSDYGTAGLWDSKEQ